MSVLGSPRYPRGEREGGKERAFPDFPGVCLGLPSLSVPGSPSLPRGLCCCCRRGGSSRSSRHFKTHLGAAERPPGLERILLGPSLRAAEGRAMNNHRAVKNADSCGISGNPWTAFRCLPSVKPSAAFQTCFIFGSLSLVLWWWTLCSRLVGVGVCVRVLSFC